MVWEIGNELDAIDLRDKRLNDRGKQLLEVLFADPAASINSACQGWAETQAAYRFFDNPKVSPEKILQSHINATRERIRQSDVVLYSI